VAAVGVLAFALGVGLSGCTPAPTGRTATDTGQQIESIPGVEKATIRASTLHDGFVTRQGVGITITVSDGYHIGDADGLIVWLAREAWSVGPKRPGSMGIRLEDSSGKSVEWGWKDALVKHGWDSPVTDEDMNSGGQLILSDSNMVSVAGESWPGPVPETPANLFVKN
jgi:hypothetical protein